MGRILTFNDILFIYIIILIYSDENVRRVVINRWNYPKLTGTPNHKPMMNINNSSGDIPISTNLSNKLSSITDDTNNDDTKPNKADADLQWRKPKNNINNNDSNISNSKDIISDITKDIINNKNDNETDNTQDSNKKSIKHDDNNENKNENIITLIDNYQSDNTNFFEWTNDDITDWINELNDDFAIEYGDKFQFNNITGKNGNHLSDINYLMTEFKMKKEIAIQFSNIVKERLRKTTLLDKKPLNNDEINNNNSNNNINNNINTDNNPNNVTDDAQDINTNNEPMLPTLEPNVSGKRSNTIKTTQGFLTNDAIEESLRKQQNNNNSNIIVSNDTIEGDINDINKPFNDKEETPSDDAEYGQDRHKTPPLRGHPAEQLDNSDDGNGAEWEDNDDDVDTNNDFQFNQVLDKEADKKYLEQTGNLPEQTNIITQEEYQRRQKIQQQNNDTNNNTANTHDEGINSMSPNKPRIPPIHHTNNNNNTDIAKQMMQEMNQHEGQASSSHHPSHNPHTQHQDAIKQQQQQQSRYSNRQEALPQEGRDIILRIEEDMRKITDYISTHQLNPEDEDRYRRHLKKLAGKRKQYILFWEKQRQYQQRHQHHEQKSPGMANNNNNNGSSSNAGSSSQKWNGREAIRKISNMNQLNHYEQYYRSQLTKMQEKAKSDVKYKSYVEYYRYKLDSVLRRKKELKVMLWKHQMKTQAHEIKAHHGEEAARQFLIDKGYYQYSSSSHQTSNNNNNDRSNKGITKLTVKKDDNPNTEKATIMKTLDTLIPNHQNNNNNDDDIIHNHKVKQPIMNNNNNNHVGTGGFDFDLRNFGYATVKKDAVKPKIYPSNNDNNDNMYSNAEEVAYEHYLFGGQNKSPQPQSPHQQHYPHASQHIPASSTRQHIKQQQQQMQQQYTQQQSTHGMSPNNIMPQGSPMAHPHHQQTAMKSEEQIRHEQATKIVQSQKLRQWLRQNALRYVSEPPPKNDEVNYVRWYKHLKKVEKAIFDKYIRKKIQQQNQNNNNNNKNNNNNNNNGNNKGYSHGYHSPSRQQTNTHNNNNNNNNQNSPVYSYQNNNVMYSPLNSPTNSGPMVNLQLQQQNAYQGYPYTPNNKNKNKNNNDNMMPPTHHHHHFNHNVTPFQQNNNNLMSPPNIMNSNENQYYKQSPQHSPIPMTNENNNNQYTTHFVHQQNNHSNPQIQILQQQNSHSNPHSNPQQYMYPQ